MEAGLPGYDAAVWWAVVAPRGTPPEIIARLNTDLEKITNMPEVQQRYASLGIATAHSTPQAVLETIRTETPQMAKILKAAGVEPE